MPMRLIISRDSCFFFFFFNDTATTEIYTLSLHDALPILRPMPRDERPMVGGIPGLGGFFIVASHSGVTLGPLWGLIAAAEILDGVPDPRLAPYRPARFLS